MALVKKFAQVWQLVAEFKNAGLEHHFSEAGLKALMEYFDDLGEDVELDVIGICCEFTEFESLEEFNNDMNEEFLSIDEIEDKTIHFQFQSHTN